MKKFKEPKEVKMDENGNPIDEKKIDWKGIGKKVAFGLTAAAVGIVTFCLVGIAMAGKADPSDESSEEGDTDISGSESGGSDGGDYSGGSDD